MEGKSLWLVFITAVVTAFAAWVVPAILDSIRFHQVSFSYSLLRTPLGLSLQYKEPNSNEAAQSIQPGRQLVLLYIENSGNSRIENLEAVVAGAVFSYRCDMPYCSVGNITPIEGGYISAGTIDGNSSIQLFVVSDSVISEFSASRNIYLISNGESIYGDMFLDGPNDIFGVATLIYRNSLLLSILIFILPFIPAVLYSIPRKLPSKRSNDAGR